MSWSHRIVRHANGSHDIREVHFDDAGAVTGVTAGVAMPAWYPEDAETGDADPRASLVRQLERQLASAREAAIVDMPVDPVDVAPVQF